MSSDHASAEVHHSHITPIPLLVRNFMMLLVLMVLTIAVAEVPHRMPSLANFQEYSLFNNCVALTIAIIKATLVIAIFMGVKYATKLTKLFAIGGFVWFLLMFFTLVDYWSRPWEPVKGWEEVPSTATPRSKSMIE